MRGYKRPASVLQRQPPHRLGGERAERRGRRPRHRRPVASGEGTLASPPTHPRRTKNRTITRGRRSGRVAMSGRHVNAADRSAQRRGATPESPPARFRRHSRPGAILNRYPLSLSDRGYQRSGDTMDLRSWRTWLRPGMLIKRWVLLFMLSVTIVSLALAMGLAWIYRNVSFPRSTSNLIEAITLQFVPHPYRELLLLVVGCGLVAYSFWRLSHAVIGPLMSLTPGSQRLAEIVAEHRFGPIRPELNVVAIGGGTGLSTLLRGLKRHSIGITAIVTVADDGGSTGRIRKSSTSRRPATSATASSRSPTTSRWSTSCSSTGSRGRVGTDRPLLRQPLHHRALQVTGSFEQAVIESARVLAIRGGVLPSTMEKVRSAPSWSTGRRSAANRRSATTSRRSSASSSVRSIRPATNRPSARSSTPT